MVERYNQPDLPSPVVGTPGVDPSAGVAAGEIASLAAKETAQQGAYAGQMIQQGGQELNHIISGVGSMIGKHVMSARAEAKATQDALQKAQVTQHNLDLADVGNKLLNDVKSNADFQQNPESAAPYLENALKNNMYDQMTGQPLLHNSKGEPVDMSAINDRWQDNPVIQAVANNGAETIHNSLMSQVRTWATQQGIAQVNSAPANIANSTANNVSQTSGTLPEQQAQYAANLSDAHAALNQLAPQLGSARVDAAKAAVVEKASVSFAHHQLGQLQKIEDPLQRITGLKQLQGIIDNGTSGNNMDVATPKGPGKVAFALDSEKGRILQGEVHTQIQAAWREQSNKDNVETIAHLNAIGTARDTMQAFASNPIVQNQAIESFKSKVLQVDTDTKKILDNPDTPDFVKEAAVIKQTQVASALRAGISEAQSNMRYQLVAEKQGIASALKLKTAEAQVKIVTARNELGLDKQNFGLQLAAQRAALAPLIEKPVENAQAIQEAAQKQYKFIQSGMDAGYVQPDKGAQEQQALLGMVAHAAQIQKAPPNALQQLLGLQNQPKQQSVLKSEAARSAAKSYLLQGAAVISQHQHEDKMANALGLSDEQKNFVSQAMAQRGMSPQGAKDTPATREAFHNLMIGIAARKYPKAPAPLINEIDQAKQAKADAELEAAQKRAALPQAEVKQPTPQDLELLKAPRYKAPTKKAQTLPAPKTTLAPPPPAVSPGIAGRFVEMTKAEALANGIRIKD